MWFMNTIANPLVRFILRSPLHGLMSAAVLLITYHGRKTGKAVTLPVQYARDGQNLFIIPGQPEKKTWWRNLRGGQPVTIWLAGKPQTAWGELVEGKTDPALAVRGLEIFLRKFPGAAGLHNVRRRAGGEFDLEDLRAAAGSLALVRVDLDRG